MNKRVKKSIRTVWLHLVVAFFSLAFAFPLLWMLMTSFETPREYYFHPPAFLPHQFVVFHYKEAFAPWTVDPNELPGHQLQGGVAGRVKSVTPTSSTR